VLVTNNTALQVPQLVRDVVASVGLNGLHCATFSVSMNAPIAGNTSGWEAYNKGDNHSELMDMEQLEKNGFKSHCGFGISKFKL
ncbi:hypothetical protein BGZ65_011248, partial [Modicella reniformis]